MAGADYIRNTLEGIEFVVSYTNIMTCMHQTQLLFCLTMNISPTNEATLQAYLLPAVQAATTKMLSTK